MLQNNGRPYEQSPSVHIHVVTNDCPWIRKKRITNTIKMGKLFSKPRYMSAWIHIYNPTVFYSRANVSLSCVIILCFQ